MDKKQGLAVLRNILQITNYYVRDRQMSYILRKSMLTQANKDSKDKTWEKNLPKWQATLKFLESSFAVK